MAEFPVTVVDAVNSLTIDNDRSITGFPLHVKWHSDYNLRFKKNK